MKKLLIITSLLFCSIPIFAQNSYSGDITDRIIDLKDKANAFGLTDAEFDAVKNQAYDNSTFLPGSIFKDDQLAKKNILLRYNANADEIEIKNSIEKEDFSAMNKESGLYAKIANETYVFVPYQGSNEKGGYFNVVTTGKRYDLYKKTTAVFRQKVLAKTTYDRERPAGFSKNVAYFLVDKGGTFYELPQGKSKLLNVMSEKKSEMKDYINKNNLDVDKQRDLAKIVDHFNAIL